MSKITDLHCSVSQGLDRGIIVVIPAKGREVPLAWEFIYMTVLANVGGPRVHKK